MSKLMYILTIFMVSFSLNAFAQDEIECLEGQTFDKELGICVDAPIEGEEAPAEVLEETLEM